MTKSEFLLAGALVTIICTVVGAFVADYLEPSLTPIIAGVGSTLSAVLSHEVVKSAGVKVINYLIGTPAIGTPAIDITSPSPAPTSTHSMPQIEVVSDMGGIDIESQASVSSFPGRPMHSRILTFTVRESSLDARWRHVTSNVETRVEETRDGPSLPTPSNSSSDLKNNNLRGVLTID